MKLYDWDVDIMVYEAGKEPVEETIRVQAINDPRVAKIGAVAKRELWPFRGRVVAKHARLVAYVKDFV